VVLAEIGFHHFETLLELGRVLVVPELRCDAGQLDEFGGDLFVGRGFVGLVGRGDVVGRLDYLEGCD
jgi:hypothetical protein